MLSCRSRLTKGPMSRLTKLQRSFKRRKHCYLTRQQVWIFGHGCLLSPAIIGVARILVILGDEKSKASALHACSGQQEGLQQRMILMVWRGFWSHFGGWRSQKTCDRSPRQINGCLCRLGMTSSLWNLVAQLTGVVGMPRNPGVKYIPPDRTPTTWWYQYMKTHNNFK